LPAVAGGNRLAAGNELRRLARFTNVLDARFRRGLLIACHAHPSRNAFDSLLERARLDQPCRSFKRKWGLRAARRARDAGAMRIARAP